MLLHTKTDVKVAGNVDLFIIICYNIRVKYGTRNETDWRYKNDIG